MGWFVNLFKNIFKGKTRYAGHLSSGTPIYSQYGHNIFASDVVMQAVNCIVSEMTKLQPTHIRKMDNDVIPQKSTIQNILDNPNELMDTSDFIEKVVWNYFFNSNSFIIPRYYTWKEHGIEKRSYIGLYPVRPSQVDFLQDESDRYFVKMYFDNNVQVTFPYQEIIHLRREFSIDEYMGGDINGQPNNDGLRETLNLNKTLLDGIAKNLKASTAINGIIKIKSFLDDAKLRKAIDDFNKLLEENQSGLLPLDNTIDYVDLKKAIRLVDNDTLKFIDTKILRNFGVSLPILTGDYTKEQYEAFYQKTLEPLIKKLGQAFTKTLFTQREKAFGNQIVFYPEELIFMNMQQKLLFVRLLGDSGTLYENEKRVAFGLKPLEELKGVRMQSLNYVNVEDAKNYQVGANNDNSKNNNNDSNAKPNNDDNGKVKENKSNDIEKINFLREVVMPKDLKDNKKDCEMRSYNFEVRAKKDEKNGTFIEGRPIVYGDNYDCCGMFEETIDRGALKKTDLTDVRFLVNHDMTKIPLARSRNNNANSTMQLSVDDDGMGIRANLDTENNAEARALYSAVERGDITGMSFCFRVEKEEWDKLDSDYPTRHIKSISKVYEVSAVTFPAYEKTSIDARSKSVLDNARASVLDSNEAKALDSAKKELELEKMKFRTKFI